MPLPAPTSRRFLALAALATLSTPAASEPPEPPYCPILRRELINDPVRMRASAGGSSGIVVTPPMADAHTLFLLTEPGELARYLERQPATPDLVTHHHLQTGDPTEIQRRQNRMLARCAPKIG